MYCRLPNAVQPCPKRAPCFVRQTFQRVRVSAIINPLPLHLGLDQQFSSSRKFPSSNIYFIRDSIKITLFFLIFEVSHVSRITLGHTLLPRHYWPFSRNHPRVTSIRLQWSRPTPDRDTKRKEEKEKKKKEKQSTQRNELSRRRREGWEERGSWRGDITICLVIRWKTSTTERRVGVFTSLTPAKKHRRQRK